MNLSLCFSARCPIRGSNLREGGMCVGVVFAFLSPRGFRCFGVEFALAFSLLACKGEAFSLAGAVRIGVALRWLMTLVPEQNIRCVYRMNSRSGDWY